MVLPPVVVQADNILVTNVELEDGTIPYTALDSLRTNHNVDVTAFSVSMTRGGHRYRAYVLRH